MKLTEMVAFCIAKAEHYTKAWESNDPNRMFLGRKPKMNSLGHQVVDRETGKPVYNTTTAKSVAYTWTERAKIFQDLVDKKTPSFLLEPTAAEATANTIIKAVKKLSPAEKDALTKALAETK